MSPAAMDAARAAVEGIAESERLRHEAAMLLVRRTIKHEDDIARCIELYGGRFSAWDENTLYWVVEVESFPAALPLIELAESFAGDCISTRDWPEYRQRDFIFGWLRIACTIKDGSEICRVIVKGFKEPEPILEF